MILGSKSSFVTGTEILSVEVSRGEVSSIVTLLRLFLTGAQAQQFVLALAPTETQIF